MKFYTIKLPRFIGGFVRVVIGMFKKRKISLLDFCQ
ncbi:stage V sporulation protein SpoVM [Virgibacillus halophilus]|uniref:Stage V sporulation protein SpoVM n=1 Tax=Tigheibacillus halophilus TaxID=361280 RepID=A0ABU5CAH4_9BACI|nr:stage V sporulation protein SpoVM [Virgibacillus halophilus]